MITMNDISTELKQLTQNYVDLWQQESGFPPASHELYGVPSPCIFVPEIMWFIGYHSLLRGEIN